MGAMGFVFLLLLYPVLYFGLLVTGFLAYVYEPLLRIGVITGIALIYLFYSLRKKYTRRQNDYLEDLSHQSGRIEGNDYHYTSNYNHKAKLTTLNTYIEGVFGYDFLLKFEGKMDRFFKLIGLSTECQSGDSRFDETVYIVSDDAWLCSQLQTDEELRNLFYDIFWHYHEQKIQLTAIRCFDGRIMISALRRSEEEDEALVREYARSVAAYLQKIVLHLPSKGSIDERMYREPTGVIAHVFSIIVFALLANGAIVLFTDMMTTVKIMPHLIHAFSVIPLSIKTTLVVLVLLMLAAFFFLRRSSRLSPVSVRIMTLGTLGILLSSIVEIKEIDTSLDTSPATVYTSQVSGKEAVHHRKHGTTYHLYFRPWDMQQSSFDLVVPYSLYAKTNEGDFARIYQHRGYLGFPWIEKIQILPFTPDLAREENAAFSDSANTEKQSLQTGERIAQNKEIMPEKSVSYLKKLYGNEFEKLSITEKEYLIANYKSMQRIAQETLFHYAASHIPAQLEANDANAIEFYFHPNGSVSNIRFIKKSKSEVLDTITEETIKLASAKFTRPKQTVLLRYRVSYQLENKKQVKN